LSSRREGVCRERGCCERGRIHRSGSVGGCIRSLSGSPRRQLAQGKRDSQRAAIHYGWRTYDGRGATYSSQPAPQGVFSLFRGASNPRQPSWVAIGGEGIVLKDPASLYYPGERSPAWLKLKPKGAGPPSMSIRS